MRDVTARSAGAAGDFEGPFAGHRAEMDYTYHVNYVPARQATTLTTTTTT